MANQKIIITKTVQYKDEKGNSVMVLPGDEAQSVPADVAKDCLARGWGKKPEKAVKKTVKGSAEPDSGAESDSAAAEGGGSGDGGQSEGDADTAQQ